MENRLLLTLLLLAGCQQSFQSKLRNNVATFKESVEVLNKNIHRDRIQRDLSDIWNKIRFKIVSAWEAFKNITIDTKKQIKAYLQKIEIKIDGIKRVFENKLENLKKEFKNVIEHIIATGINVKNCVKDDKTVIETILMEIFINVTTCISNNLKFMANIDISNNSLDTDDSVFLNLVQSKIKTCDETMDQCLNNVENEILADIDIATWNVSKKAFEIRNAADSSIDTIKACIHEGLAVASTAITNETVEIIKCVKDKE